MIEIVYFTTKVKANQTKVFDSVSKFNAWVRRQLGTLMDYTLIKQPEGYRLPLHYADWLDKEAMRD